MAVPNSSRPPTTNVVIGGLAEGAGRLLPVGKAKLPPGPPAQEEESDEEEEDGQAVLTIDLSGLQESMEAAANSGRLSSGAARPPPCPGTAGEREERDVQQVVASTSTLAVHLQRAKPQEWNELIQVVLQGLIFARSSAGRGLGTPKA